MTGRSERQQGVTLLELLVTIAIIGILAAIAGPYMGDYVERQRWVGATEAVYGQLQQAKRAAISNNKQIYFKVTSAASASWCAGYGEANTCDCSVANSCQVNGQNTLSISATDYPGISVLDADALAATSINSGFTMPGVSASAATLAIRSASLGDIEVEVESVGRVKVCSDDLGQYPDC